MWRVLPFDAVLLKHLIIEGKSISSLDSQMAVGCGIDCPRCARDAKFAVECDTCKMSYCLVYLSCLGYKRPLRPMRCGHQLVHLRLKSIYKAFQQSASHSHHHHPDYPSGLCLATNITNPYIV